MAIFKNAFFQANSVDLSAFVQSVELNFDTELQDDTAMGDSARSNDPGLDVWGYTVRFLNPFAASGPDATLSPLRGAAPFNVTFRPDAGVVATTNPQWSGNAVVGPLRPVGGAVGEEMVCECTFAPAGTNTRTTA